MHRFRSTSRWAAAAVAVALAGTLAACSSGSTDAADATGATQAEIDAALQKESSITFWTWAPQAEDIVDAFEKKYPKIDVKLENVGTGNDHYTKLQNAIKAGSGAPDVAQIEYYAFPQFALSGSLADLTDFGAADLADQYTPGTWGSVAINGGIYGLPQDSGPMAMFYRQDVFDDLGIDVPTTWDEYLDAARKIHAANPDHYIVNDIGDPGFAQSMIWQAGGQPYTVDGENVGIDFAGDEGTQKWTSVWNQMIAEDLVAPVASWSDEWFKGLGDGSIASLVTGAWMPGNLENGAPAGAGQWRVAPVPTYDGTVANSENGGGGDAVIEQSKNKLVAYGFLQFLNGPEGAAIHAAGGGFPSTVADLESDEFLNYESDYFGGQKINEVLSQASKDVLPGWTYLPFQAYSNSIFGDTVGQVYEDKGDLNDGLAAWQDAGLQYGEEQGFTITGK
ncbi:sugar ABC transporter substrate-binding protein [Agromyces sp. Leaf222]|uniref:ABC transporter substrate-binding protein n=1 Tax=Agromyces sp. Leaf222 TaxID=1735688 RepID=UPI000700BA03|nr:sugar ABC transporter substrate-binding protein [Agromyces sp. Leaf222]KQM83600.1 sugar ABC transporter substrate-binding protein [Agromyces sp. Leaf222]